MKNQKKLTGKRVERLIVGDIVGYTEGKKRYKIYRCTCDCGTIKDVASYLLTSGRVKSCGCLKSESIIKSAKSNIKNHTNVGLVTKNTVRSSNKSGFPGVYQNKLGKWIASITFQGKRKYLGYFDEKEEAIQARLDAEKEVTLFLENVILQKENDKNGKCR